MVADLRALVKRERMLTISVGNIQQFLNNYQPDRDEMQVSVRLQILEAAYLEFFEIRQKIELRMDEIEAEKPVEESPEAKKERHQEYDHIVGEFDDRFCFLKGQLLRLQTQRERLASNTSEDQSTSQAGATLSRVKLPEIHLPTFDGNLQEWVTFRDSFRSLIHNCTQLTEMDKFTYLKSSLSGSALQEVNTIELSAANYLVAWEALEKRYENKKLIVKAHLDTLFAVEGLRKESYDGLSHLIGEFEKNIKMLEKIGEEPSKWSTILAYMVCCRLDAATLRQWETHHSSTEVPTYENLLQYLRKHCSVLQSIATCITSGSEQQQSRQISSDHQWLKPAVCHALVKAPNRCPFCGEAWHSAFQCNRFQKMKTHERNEAVFRSKLCWNYLHPGHQSRDCDRGACRYCHQKHHSMLHADRERSSVPQSQSRPPTPVLSPRQPQTSPRNPNQQTHTDTTLNANSQNTDTQSAHATCSYACLALPDKPTHETLMPTALVRIQDRFGNSLLARALLDSCSQHCLMSQDFSRRLQFRETPAFLSITGIGPTPAVSTKLVSVVVCPWSQRIPQFVAEMEFFVLPNLAVCLPAASIDTSDWNLPESAFLADPRFHQAGPVDVIVGAEHFMNLLKAERRNATDDGPTLQNTVFGRIVSGQVNKKQLKKSAKYMEQSRRNGSLGCRRKIKRWRPVNHFDRGSQIQRFNVQPNSAGKQHLVTPSVTSRRSVAESSQNASSSCGPKGLAAPGHIVREEGRSHRNSTAVPTSAWVSGKSSCQHKTSVNESFRQSPTEAVLNRR